MVDNIIYVNSAEGIKRVMNNVKLYIKLLTKFKNDTKLDEVENAFTAGDREKTQNAVHTLKGIAANLSLTELFKQSLNLETQVKAGQLNSDQMETVKTVFFATMREVDKVIEQNG